MFEPCQDLALMAETGHHSGGTQATLDHFEGHELAVMLVIALSQVDRAHTASPDLPEHAIGSQSSANQRRLVQHRGSFRFNGREHDRFVGTVRTEQ